MSAANTLDERIQFLLSLAVADEPAIIASLDQLVKDFGADEVQRYCIPQSRQKNCLIHEFVRLGLLRTIEHAVGELNFDINLKRESDGNTPAHLAYWYRKPEVGAVLKNLQADTSVANKYGESVNDLEKQREKMMNIIWLDTELTSLDDPYILECAVIITDKNLNALERGHWVVHFDKEDLEKLSEFHQNVFKSHAAGGNGLFDEVLASTTTKEEMEKELLELIKRHCPEKACPLAGSSIHWDREVVRLRMPSVYHHLHHRIIDVSSFFGMVERWSTSERWAEKEKHIESVMHARYPDGNGVHRAMYDIERSIELLRSFQPCLANF